MTWLLRCSVRQVIGGSQPATVGELHPLHRKALRHPLILDGLSLRLTPCGARQRYCACTFYLVFKEPDFLRVPLCLFLAQGNLSILLTTADPVNPYSLFFLACRLCRAAVRRRAIAPVEQRTAENG